MSVRHYADASFWEDRFGSQSGGEAFDWYCAYRELKEHFHRHSPDKNAGILMVGCGNSQLSSEMAADGYRNVTNVDISPSVIRLMKQKDAHGMAWVTMDATHMALRNGVFDIAIDKGTFDALSCGDGNRSEFASTPSTALMVAEISRVLRCGGLFYLISHSGWPRRQAHFPSHQWELVYACEVELNDMAEFINILRSKVHPRPLREAFLPENGHILKEAGEEYRTAMRRKLLRRLFARIRPALRRQQEEQQQPTAPGGLSTTSADDNSRRRDDGCSVGPPPMPSDGCATAEPSPPPPPPAADTLKQGGGSVDGAGVGASGLRQQYCHLIIVRKTAAGG
ncbi:unnamed protein product [Vitrella brassicaformis CCMP3155]|uniref:Methyltransferase type 11 domain-containing protein n=2 Tax=Vitrella brassicaformis TaxID=1169539 RepID=A0A0G4H042_VITBC|nr:unnamed protein product [Vitrella brassicaformis CCMP3155]|mmetsp:Transcript_1051/g.2760  ORF Transcript_1051/g.2760 Transcript_1051/m.2760 type:complete len:338 (-) Transcript_1051:541-1554(-)|eukprot:CEM36870.1 unnamed protein product [Vitrella brassicaformis CCMP3155]